MILHCWHLTISFVFSIFIVIFIHFKLSPKPIRKGGHDLSLNCTQKPAGGWSLQHSHADSITGFRKWVVGEKREERSEAKRKRTEEGNGALLAVHSPIELPLFTRIQCYRSIGLMFTAGIVEII